MTATTQTFDNALVIEFLAQHNPELIKQWHAQTGINALKQLAEEFNPPEHEPVTPEYPLIDEREVYEFLDLIIGCNDEADLLFGDDYETMADFFANDKDPKQQLFDLWRGCKGCFDRDLYPLSKYDCEVLK